MVASRRGWSKNPDTASTARIETVQRWRLFFAHPTAQPRAKNQKPVRVPAGEVAGEQCVHLASEREVLRALGVAKHDVRTGVDRFVVGGPSTESMRNEPLGIGTPMVPGCSAARPGGRYAIRAVASVAPYMTNRSQPRCWPVSAQDRTLSGASPCLRAGGAVAGSGLRQGRHRDPRTCRSSSCCYCSVEED